MSVRVATERVALPLLLIISIGCAATTDVAPTDEHPGASVAGSASASGPASAEPTSPVAVVPDWRTDPDEPYPFEGPVPAYAATAVDGVYTRQPTDRYVGHRAPCRRCPPYPGDRGVSSLELRSGRFLVRHSRPAYRNLGHYRIVGDRIEFFNDIECAHERGSYRWDVVEGDLVLSDPRDACAFGQRWKDLTALPWRISGDAAARIECQPPNEEAAVTGHWSLPAGC